MISPTGSHTPSNNRQKVNLFFTILVLVSMACSLPGLGKKTATETAPVLQGEQSQPKPTGEENVAPTAPPSPTSTPAPLPPALVEASPPTGSALALNEAITLFFNQAMEQTSVEAALSGEPPLSGSFAWVDEATLTYTPDQPFLPETALMITIAETAQAKNGMAMLVPAVLSYNTSGYLQVSQTLPENTTRDVSTTSAIVAAFNQPVTALGADPATLPAGFTLEPAAPGRGEWVNTSTYIFYPEPGLAGGTTFTASINPDLRSTDGGPLEENYAWYFSTADPRMVSMEPGGDITDARLDTGVKITFNMSMDVASVEENFSLVDATGNAVEGDFTWRDDLTTMIFTPTALLARDSQYTVTLEPAAAAAGGTPIGNRYQISWSTVPELGIVSTDPTEGGNKQYYGAITIFLTSPVRDKDLEDLITVSPEVSNYGVYQDTTNKAIYINGMFETDSEYQVTVSGELTDLWGSELGQDFTLNIRTLPPESRLSFPYTTEGNFLTTEDDGVMAFATNLSSIPVTVGKVGLEDFIQMLGPNGYDSRRGYQPDEPRSWTESIETAHDQSETITLPLSPEGGPVEPGLYFMRLNPAVQYPPTPLLIAVSNYHTTFKIGSGQAFVWAVDLRSNTPAAGLAVSIYDETGTLLTSGQTGSDGTFEQSIPVIENRYGSFFAVLGDPGQRDFGMAVSNWNDSVNPWDFGLSSSYYTPGLKVYLYTDRPIYRPGQTVYFRLALREVKNGRYTLPDLGSYSLSLWDGYGQELEKYDLPLSAFGTGYGEYTLSEDAQPGNYGFGNIEGHISLYFQVAEYRKPEINLQVNTVNEQILAGEAFVAQVNARYFFDAPVNELPVEWALYAKDSHFYLPGNYQVGPYDIGWADYFYMPSFGDWLGDTVSWGKGMTDADGLLTLELPTEASIGRQLYTLEVTASDESGLPISARVSLQANPADFFIGVHPDAWSGESGRESGFDVLTVDWEGQPSGGHTLTALFQKVEWVREDPPAEYAGISWPSFKRVYTTVASSEFTTSDEGAARLAFTPQEPGTYQVDVSGEGTTTQVMIWVGGRGRGIWPDLPNQRLRLTADADAYQPGDTAGIFIPNPFNAPALGLVSVERGIVMRHEVVEVQAGGSNYSLPLSDDDAPNVYIAVTLLGLDAQGRTDFRQGYLELSVEPVEQVLNVSLVSEPERSGPGEEVTFHLRVTDSAGNPVQGEFSLSVVDLAALALADPNAPDIVNAFYGKQPLGVRTGLSLAAWAQRLIYSPGGMGGGGGAESGVVIREDFPDTAYWNPVVVTDANGEASLTIQLPDSLTTWQVEARGLTEDTRVGTAEVELVTTKDVLVRPVTPRFLVAGDHAQLAAVVNNNTSNELQAEVTLQSTGFTLDDTVTASQVITVAAGGRGRVEWWGRADNAASADLLFSVRSTTEGSAGTLDAVRVANGALPILRYTTPQTFATSGVMDTAGERLELVSLPVSYDVTNGELKLELAASVAGVIVETLKVLENPTYDCTEQVLSSFFPNLQAYLVLQSFGIQAPELQARLESSLQEGVKTLLARQNDSGGWGWWAGQVTDMTVTAYVLFGLSSAQQAGIAVPDETIQRAVEALNAGRIAPNMASRPWQLNQLAFINFALDKAGSGDTALANQLYQVRDQLSPWAQALLALTLENLSPGNPQTDTLISDLQTSGIRTATGIHWEEAQPDYHNLAGHASTTAMVIYSLAQLEPAAQLLPDAVNYQMSSRLPYGGWGSTFDDAWTVLAMSEYMKGSGELSSSYNFEALLNGTAIASGQAAGDTQLTPVETTQPVSALYPDDPNALLIRRGEGGGRLYYNASLQVYRPVEQVSALSRGLSLSRTYYPAGVDLKTATPVQSAQVGEAVTVRLTLVLPNEAYYIIVEDYIPAGAEILDSSLKTVQQGEFEEPGPLYDPNDPFASGWGWWLFEPARIYDEHIAFAANYLPAGTYELTYTLVLLQPGEYQAMPARAWMFYFPEVQGSTAGEVFTIIP